MRREHDGANDILWTVHSDGPVATSKEYEVDGTRNVLHYDKDGKLVRREVHNYSQVLDYYSGKLAQTTRRDIPPELDRKDVVGHIEWVVTESATATILTEGEKSVCLEEVHIQYIESSDSIVVSKRFALDQTYLLGIAGGNETDALGCGFGLVCDRTDFRTFCWEWFNLDGSDHATKLQETGELAIRAGSPGGLWQVVRTEFLTDVSMRVHRFGIGRSGDVPRWRVLIRKGSWVDWPTVADGLVTMS